MERRSIRIIQIQENSIMWNKIKSFGENSAKSALNSTLMNKGAFDSDAMKVIKSVIGMIKN